MSKVRGIRRVLGLAFISTIMCVSLLACSSSDEQESQQPVVTQTASPAAASATATETATPTATPEAVSFGPYPVSLMDLLGREIVIESEPQSVVALSPTALEYIYAIGGEAAGRPSTARHPASAMSVAEVGTSYSPNFEAVLALNPDLIIADSVIHAQPRFLEMFEGMPAPVMMAGAASYDDVLLALELVGTALNREDDAQAEIARIESAFESAKSNLPGGLTVVVLIADRDNTLYAAKNTAFVGNIIGELGLVNPASDLPDAGPFPGFSTASIESMLMWNPDFIFTITPAPEPAPRLSALLTRIPPLQGLGAVRMGSVMELSNDLALRSPGPRVDELMDAIVSALQ